MKKVMVSKNRIAVVTGANKGIGLETVRQLATAGVTVVLTARDESRGAHSASQLHQSGLPNVVFHQLDVTDSHSIATLARFIHSTFGTLHILISGKAAPLVQGVMRTTYEKAEECFNTNYYGCKRVIEALLPLLERSSTGARIVNVSSLRGALWRIPNEETRNEFADIEKLTEKRIDEILQNFLEDVKEDALVEKGWPLMLPAYGVSKTALNAYTRILAKRYPNMYINCVHPGYVDTDLNWHTGTMTAEDGAKNPVTLALLPDGGPSGCYFDQTQVADF